MKVSEGQTQQNMVESITTKEIAFKHVWKALVRVNDFKKPELLLEEDVIKNLPILANASFKTEDDAQGYFDKMEKQQIVLKKLGRFYLG